MRIDCEVHGFRLESRQAAHIIDGSMETLEGAARQSRITGLVLVQPAFLNGDAAELFAQASQTPMPVRLIPPLVQPLAPEVLEEWARSSAVGLAQLTLTDPDPLAEPLEAALQLDFHLEVSGGLEGRERLAELLLADGHRLVFRGFGLADSARDPACDPRFARLLAVAQGAELWVKLSGSNTSQMAGREQLQPEWCRSSGRHSSAGARSGRTWQPPRPARHSMRRHLSALRNSSQTRTPEGESLARRLRPFTDFDKLRPGHLPKWPNEHHPLERWLAAERDFAQEVDQGSPSKLSENPHRMRVKPVGRKSRHRIGLAMDADVQTTVEVIC